MIFQKNHEVRFINTIHKKQIKNTNKYKKTQ